MVASALFKCACYANHTRMRIYHIKSQLRIPFLRDSGPSEPPPHEFYMEHGLRGHVGRAGEEAGTRGLASALSCIDRSLLDASPKLEMTLCYFVQIKDRESRISGQSGDS